NLSQNEVHSDPDLILYNPSVLIDKEPLKDSKETVIGNCDDFLSSLKDERPFQKLSLKIIISF
ncbi:hypothetical protein DPW27_14980, partial [Enterococcus faecium]